MQSTSPRIPSNFLPESQFVAKLTKPLSNQTAEGECLDRIFTLKRNREGPLCLWINVETVARSSRDVVIKAKKIDMDNVFIQSVSSLKDLRSADFVPKKSPLKSFENHKLWVPLAWKAFLEKVFKGSPNNVQFKKDTIIITHSG